MKKINKLINMRKKILVLIIIFLVITNYLNAQGFEFTNSKTKNLVIDKNFFLTMDCDQLMTYVKKYGDETTYNIYSSDVLSRVSFYELTIDYSTLYFAIVCFKTQYYGCNEYIYQVGSTTRSNFSINYYQSAGKAFWNYIHPYRSVLGCAPNLD
jgi:hypothetical protein